MAINIPSSVFDIYNEAVELFTRTATLIYPPKKESCPNCYLDSLGTRARSISKYKPGGPIPFVDGMPCPYCNGQGYRATETTEDVTVRMYFSRKDFVDIGIPIDLANNVVQIIFKSEDIAKAERANYLQPKSYGDISTFHTIKLKRTGASFPQGFKQNPQKYYVTFWERYE